MSFIDAHRGRYGVGPVCAEVPIAPSTDYEHKAREGEAERAPGRVRRDGWRCGEIRRVYDEHFAVYGVRKVWRQLRREGVAVARCTVARLMRRLGLQGAVRGRRAKTTQSVVQGERPDDRVNREFKVSRPNALWVSDLPPVSTGAGSMWRRGGGSPTRPSSSTPMRGVSPLSRGRAGGCRIHCTRTWPSMPSNRPFTSAVRPVKDSSIIATGACSISRCATPSASCRGASRPRWEAWATPTTTRWPSPSSGCTRRNSSHGAGRGVTARRWSSPSSTGCTVQPPAPVRTPRTCASG